MFIWSGKGGLVLLAIIANLLLTAFVGDFFGYKDGTSQSHILEFFVAIILFIPIWIYGKKWNAEVRTYIDKETGKEIVFKNKHTAFWVPMQYWIIIWPVILLLVFIL